MDTAKMVDLINGCLHDKESYAWKHTHPEGNTQSSFYSDLHKKSRAFTLHITMQKHMITNQVDEANVIHSIDKHTHATWSVIG